MTNPPKLNELPIRSNYFDRAVDETAEVVKEARERLKGVKFDTFVATGLSGAVMAPVLARAMRKKFLVLRKPDDLSTHSSTRAVGRLGKRWVFLDDFVSSGATRQRVMDQIEELLDQQMASSGHFDPDKGVWVDGTERFVTEYVGDYLYARSLSNGGGFEPAEGWV